MWSAVHSATGARVAVKIILLKDDDKEAIFWIHREIEVMKPVGAVPRYPCPYCPFTSVTSSATTTHVVLFRVGMPFR